jgi:hypothetical protein
MKPLSRFYKLNQTFQERLAAGNHRYSVGTETARFRATSRGGIPPPSSCLADSILPIVILRGRPPIRPSFLAAPSPARRLARAPFVRG